MEEMAHTGMYISDLRMHNSSQEMVLSGIQPLPELEYARDQVPGDFIVVLRDVMPCSGALRDIPKNWPNRLRHDVLLFRYYDCY